MTGKETQQRIHYDGIGLKFNPNAEDNPWEIWVDGRFEMASTTPKEVLEIWADETDRQNLYTGTDGTPNHDRYPDDYEPHDVLASPTMEVGCVPSEGVQAALWDALKVRDGDVLRLPDFCEERGIDFDEAVRAVEMLSAHGSESLVDWGTSIRSVWLSPEGRDRDRPGWFQGEADMTDSSSGSDGSSVRRDHGRSVRMEKSTYSVAAVAVNDGRNAINEDGN